MTKHRDLFTSRQLLALTTFSDLVKESHPYILADAKAAGLPDDGKNLESGGSGALAYADAVVTYLAIGVDRTADYCSNLSTWIAPVQAIRGVFGRQTLSMTWDFAESNPLTVGTGSTGSAIQWIKKAVECASAGARAKIFSATHGDSAFPRSCTATIRLTTTMCRTQISPTSTISGSGS